ncbi:hypothetical protein, partial [Shewanella sp. T24-MNA-CIBAN-0130]|uniref:hypothetical protein n=1 Tax=Shewanella sp. T24-MNA-CIBAN-0130 TaxID=3140470 RepID=UPI00332D13C6
LIAPENAKTGSVTVKRNTEFKIIPFTLLENRVDIRFGDNGNNADDKFALWINNKQIGLMSSGARVVNISEQLQPGSYTVELKG